MKVMRRQVPIVKPQMIRNEDGTVTINLPRGWEVDGLNDEEGGQPNGAGVIEDNGNREWFREEDTTHVRGVLSAYGPWEPVKR